MDDVSIKVVENDWWFHPLSGSHRTGKLGRGVIMFNSSKYLTCVWTCVEEKEDNT